jgi:hypothetical protein
MTTQHPDSDRDYFYHRAEAELEMAQRSAIPSAVQAHYALAGHYLDKVYASAVANDDPSPPEDDAIPA